MVSRSSGFWQRCVQSAFQRAAARVGTLQKRSGARRQFRTRGGEIAQVLESRALLSFTTANTTQTLAMSSTPQPAFPSATTTSSSANDFATNSKGAIFRVGSVSTADTITFPATNGFTVSGSNLSWTGTINGTSRTFTNFATLSTAAVASFPIGTNQTTTGNVNAVSCLTVTFANGAGVNTTLRNLTATDQNVFGQLVARQFHVASSSTATTTRTLRLHTVDAQGSATNSYQSNTMVYPNTVSTTAGSINYTEGAAATVVDSGVSISGTFATNHTLTVEFSAVAGAGATVGLTEDELAVTPGTGNGLSVTVSGNAVSVGGTQVATFTGGTQGSDLVLTLTAAATQARVNAIAQRVTYRNTSTGPNTGTRTVRFAYNNGATGANTRNVTITAVNDAPTVSGGGTANYIENNSSAPFNVPVLVNTAGTIADVDSASFNGGSLTAALTANGTADDRLSIVAGTPSGFLAVSTSGSNVLYGASVIGTFTGGTGTTPLVISFNSALATPAAATAVMRQIGFANISDNPSTLTRTVTFTANDGSGTATATGSATASVSVAGVDDPPVFGILPSASVPENTQVVGTYTAEDPDNTGITWSLTGGTDAAKFTINATTGELSFIVAPDYENPTDAGGDNTYLVRVTATSGGLQINTLETVTVNPVNDNAPASNFDLTPSVDEGTTSVVTVQATDADRPVELTTFSYSIVGGLDAARFTINASTGLLAFNTAPDFESPTDNGGNNVYDVTVRVSDGHPTAALSSDFNVAVTVANVNPGTPVIETGSALSVAENTQNVALISATDADLHQVTFSITGDAANLFELVSPSFDSQAGRTTVQLRFQNAAGLDYEALASESFQVTIQASDGQGAEAKTTSRTFTVTLLPQNESAPAWQTGASRTTTENNVSSSYTGVVSLVATDADNSAFGTPQSVTYAITGGADQGLFTLDGPVLRFVESFDLDTQADNVFEVTVTAYDGTIGANGTLSTARTFTVTVTGANDNSPQFPGASQANLFNPRVDVSIAEQTTTSVGTATATDADKFPAQSITYSLVAENDYQLFDIDPSTGVLTFKAAPDYETPASVLSSNLYQVMVQASDGTNVGTTEYFVTVTPVNEHNPSITSGASVTFAESSATTVNVQVVTATDSDLPAATLNYAITGGADAALFNINASTGVVRFNATQDRENPSDADEDGVYELQVTAYDGVAGQPGTRSGSQNLTVTLLGENDNDPQFTVTGTLAVAEGTSGTLLTAAATDADIDPTQTLTYELVSGQDSGVFTFNAQTGALSFTAAPNFENPQDGGGDNVYNATIRVSDGTRTADLAVAVTVTNLTYSITPSVASVAYTENGSPVAFDSGFTIVDQDPEGDTLLPGGYFNIDAATGNRKNRVSVASSGDANQGLYFNTASPWDVRYNGVHFATASYGTNPGVPDERAYFTLMSELPQGAPAMQDMVQALARALRFSNAGEDTGNGFTSSVKFSVATKLTTTSTAATEVSRIFLPVVVASAPDAPVFVGGTNTLRTFTEGGAPVAIDSTISWQDPDYSAFSAASAGLTLGSYRLEASITDGLQEGADELVLTGYTVNPTTGVITNSTNTVFGVFTRTSPSSFSITSAANPPARALEFLMRSVAFRNTSQAPTTATRTVQLTVLEPESFTDPLSSSITRSVTVAPVNTAPWMTSAAAPVGFTEGGQAVVLASDLVVGDVDTTNFANGKLTATLAAVKTGDVLQIISAAQTQTTGQIYYEPLTATTGNVYYGADLIGSVSRTASALTVTLTSAASQAATQALARSIGYQSTANAFLANDSRVIRLQLNDGVATTANSNLVSVTVNITDSNDAPVLGPTTAPIASYTENGAAVAALATFTATDPDLFLRTATGNFTGAALTVSIGSGSAADELNIGAIGGVTVSSAAASNDNARDVSVSGTVVGSVIGGVGTTPLVITWNSAATLDRVQLVGRAVTFRNTSDNPATNDRTVQFSLSETRDSAVSNTVAGTVKVIAVNDAAAIAFTAGSAQTFTEDGSPVLVLAGATFAISDVDNSTFNNGALQVTIKAGGATTDRLTVVAGNGVTRGTGANAAQVFYNIGGTPTLVGTMSSIAATTSLKITFNASATLAAVNAVAGQIGYSTTSQDPSPTTSRTIGFTFFDGAAWNTGGEAVQPVSVQPVNDAPVVKLATTVASWTEQAVAVLVDSTNAISDVDTAVLNGGVLTVALASEIGGNSPQVGFVVSADDRLSIVTSTTNAGVRVVEGEVRVWDSASTSFVAVGTMTGSGTSSSPLVVTFNSNATVARVQTVARAVAFRSLPSNADNPTPGQRAVTFTLSDGDTNVATGETSATSLTAARIINVVAKNDNATMTGLAAVTTTRANPARLGTNAVVADPDSPNFGGGYLRVELTAGRATEDVLEIAPGLGFTVDEFNQVTYTAGEFSAVIGTQTWISSGTTTKQLTIALEANVTPAIAQALARAIRYRFDGSTLTAKQTKSVRWTLSDGDADAGQLPLSYTQALTVNP